MPSREIPERIRKMQPLWGEWAIDIPLGKGAYGQVFRITKKRGEARFAALKWIPIPKDESIYDGLSASLLDEKKDSIEAMKNQLMMEVRTMEQVQNNRNVVRMEECSVIERPNRMGYDILIRMELLTPLTQKYPLGPLEEAIVVQMGLDICAALAVCENQNLIHRDIKPGNIFIDDWGNFKLGDFGIARVLEQGEAGTTKIGTPAYMAPEMMNPNQQYDETVDIYALALTMYRYVNDGRLPFFHETHGTATMSRENQAIQRRLMLEPIPPATQASEPLNKVLLKAMDPDPGKRYRDASEMWRDLAAIPVEYSRPASVSSTGSTPPPSSGPVSIRRFKEPDSVTIPPEDKSVKKKDKTPVLIAVLSIILVVIVLALILSFVNWNPEPAPSPTLEPTSIPVPEPTDTVEPVPTDTPVPQPTDTPRPTDAPTPIPTDAPTPTPVATYTPTPKPTDTPTPRPTDTPTPKPTDTPTPKPTDSPTPRPTDTPTPRPTDTPTPRPTDTPTPKPTFTPTPKPTFTPAPETTFTPTPKPTFTPEPKATFTPTPKPTFTPEPKPTFTPTPKPTFTPTPRPTFTPTPK